jgi:saccharopepsin
VSYGGPVSEDTVSISDLSIPSQKFLEWTSATCTSIGCVKGGSEIGGYDGVLPLSPPWKTPQNPEMPNPLSSLLSNNLLDKPIFSIKLPHTQGESGELLLGGINPSLHSGPLHTIPVIDASSPNNSYFSNLWTLSLTHLTLDTRIPLTLTTPSYLAVLDTAEPWLILPSDLARNMSHAIGAQPGPYWFTNVPCSTRAELPILTIGLGGYNFSLSAWDYTHEVDFEHVGLMCITTFWPADDFGFEETETVLLGSPFLKGVYGVFDMANKEVSRKWRVSLS